MRVPPFIPGPMGETPKHLNRKLLRSDVLWVGEGRQPGGVGEVGGEAVGLAPQVSLPEKQGTDFHFSIALVSPVFPTLPHPTSPHPTPFASARCFCVSLLSLSSLFILSPHLSVSLFSVSVSCLFISFSNSVSYPSLFLPVTFSLPISISVSLLPSFFFVFNSSSLPVCVCILLNLISDPLPFYR